MIKIFILILTIVIFSFFGITESKRVSAYYYGFEKLYFTLDPSLISQPPLNAAANELYPIWHRWIEVKELNIFPLIFGTGLGSTSVINSFYFDLHKSESVGIINPNANIIRVIYEVGILGTLIYIAAFIFPIKRFFLPRGIIFKFIICMLLIIGSNLAHRSMTSFLFLGLLLQVINIKYLPYYFNNNSKFSPL